MKKKHYNLINYGGDFQNQVQGCSCIKGLASSEASERKIWGTELVKQKIEHLEYF